MNIKLFRIVATLLAAWIIYNQSYLMLLYCVVFTAFVEYLNSRWEYKNYQSKLINLLFMLFLTGETALRIIGYSTSQKIRYLINSFEHLLFAWVVCLIFYLLLDLSFYFRKLSFNAKLIFAAIGFNIIGLVNEVVQNIAQQMPALLFRKGNYIDLAVNIVGASLFVVGGYLYKWWKSYTTSVTFSRDY